MQIEQRSWTAAAGWAVARSTSGMKTPQLVLVFDALDEISPFTPSTRGELHNQTMTITAMWER